MPDSNLAYNTQLFSKANLAIIKQSGYSNLQSFDIASRPAAAAELRRMLHNARLEMPEMIRADHPMPMASAMRGKRSEVVFLSNSLLNLLDDKELAAVIGHELGHVINRDQEISPETRNHVATACPVLSSAICAALLWHYKLKEPYKEKTRRDFFKQDVRPAAYTMTISALAGTYAGSYASSLCYLNNEKNADHVSNRLSGDHKPLLSALEKISNAIGHPNEPGIKYRTDAIRNEASFRNR